jgi:DNA-directed RNA polymerase beta subunit/DNA-directed RNA polymerase beta' subunit
MARLNPEIGFSVLKDKVIAATKDVFPIVGNDRTLELHDVAIPGEINLDDLRGQKETKLQGRSWTVPVHATLALKDNRTGDVVEKKKVKLMDIPKPTSRLSYIIDGKEYQVDNQWRLKPGAYSMIKDDGSLETHFNTAGVKGRDFKLHFDPESKKFQLEYDGKHVPLAPVLQGLGVPTEAIEKHWGSEIFEANKADPVKVITKFHEIATGQKAPSLEQAHAVLKDTFENTGSRADVNEITLGHPYTTANGDAIMAASNKLLGISRGTVKPDPRDSLMFKDLHSVEDFVGERIQAGAKEITRKVKNTIDRKDKGIRDIVAPDVFNKSVRSLFTGGSGLAGTPTQHNPLEMLSNQMKTTVMGKGGIHDFHVVSEDAKLVDPSHMGFMDPLHTSEGQDVGIGLRLPVGIGKRGHDVTMRVYDMKTGKSKEITPKEAMFSKVVLPDQVKWEKGKPVPISTQISMSGVGNEIVSAPMHEADYVMLDPIQLFSTSTNMIPFMPADHPNRTTMAGRHMEQAISLKNRAAPLVQSMAGNISFEKMVGSYASHVANVDGTVHKIKKDAIVVEDAGGKKHETHTYDNFPLNTDRVFIHSEPIVKVGDKVKKGQVIADTNYTKDGHLALGTNLRVAYMPYKGYNFEDGVVISETAAQKLSSEHLYRNELERDATHVLDKKKYRAYVPMSLTKEQADKLDDDGVVHKGQVVMPGDTLIAALRQKGESERREDADLAKLHKSIVTPYKDASVKWDADHPGVVEEVSKTGRNVAVHVKTLQPMEVGDKLAGRHGNKGIVTRIVPDHEMPVTKDGRPTEVLLNPAGVPGRTNLGQLLEVSAGKIAEKTGKTYYVKNFEPGVDLHQKVTDELKAHDLPDKEDVVDPITGRVMGQALVGPQHIVKLVHQVDKKMIARAGGPGYTYDSSMVPKGGGPHGAQSLGALGLYAMLAHGAVHNLREMYTLKSDAAQNDQFWHAIQAGEALPAPRPTFSYNKFISYLKAIGINVKKEGNNLTLVPMTDKQVLEMSNGEVKNPAKWVRAKNMAPEKDGLFDPRITGGMNGTQWAHMTLPEPFPNPVFEDPTPNQRGAIRTLLGLKGNSYDDLVAGRIAVDKTGKVVATDASGAMVGGKAIDHLLGKIDVKAELAQAKLDIEKPNLKGSKLDEVNKKIKFLTALQTAGLSPSQAYMMHHVPIIPPVMRPLSVSDGNRISEDDLNGLYKYVHLSAQKYKEMSPLIPDDDEAKVALREEIHDGLRALTGIGGYPSQVRRGVLDIIAGKRVVNRQTGEKSGSPKEGFFQDKMVSRKQDLTMRSTIVPEPSLGLDEVGIPKPAALELYKPFVIKELRKLQDITPLQARAQIEKGGGMVDRALERVVSERPILIKRDPVLHKYSIQAFKPRVVSGRTIQIHPLVTSGFNADFDGDAMGAFVPVSSQAVEEAKRMMPSHNLFSPSTGKIMYAPTHEMKLGLYGITKDGHTTDKAYKDIHEVEAAVRKGDAKLNDVVTVSGIKASVGRFLVAGALPEIMRKELLTSRMPLNGKAQDALLDRLAREHKNEYGTIVNRLKDLGNQWSTQNAFSLGLSDVAPDRALRDKILAAADAEVKKATGAKKDDQIISAYTKATEQMHAHLSGLSDEHSNLMTMHHAGVKPAMDTLRQIKMAPMLVMDAKGRTIPTPIRKSYAEGLDISGYWTSTSGARKGAIQKVQSVSDPGYTSKMVMNTTMNTLVKDHDCGTDKGISLDVDERDILDRFTAAPIKVGSKTIPAGTLITPEVKNTLRNNKIGKVVVRSPLRCLHGPGICQKCFGLDSDGNLPPVGTNIGVLAGQALGERSVQLAMKAFHTGGSAASKAELTDDFKQVSNLLSVPKTLPGSATLSTVTGKVDDIRKDPAGGHDVIIDGKRHYVPHSRGLPVYEGVPIKKGMEVKKGSAISGGPVNPHELLDLTGIEHTQGHIAGALYDLYKGEGIRRRNAEVVVKAATNLTEVLHPGSSTEFIRGDYAPTSKVQAYNRSLPKGHVPIVHKPLLKGVEMMPLEMQEDWLAQLNHQRLHETVINAAQRGWTSAIHGPHPIPAIAYAAQFGMGKPGEY